MTSPPFDLFNYRLIKQVTNAYKNHFFQGQTKIALSIYVLKPANCSPYIAVQFIRYNNVYKAKN